MTAQYHRNLLEASGGDIGMLDTDGCVTLCTVCGSAIERQADTYALKRANDVRESLTAILDNHAKRLRSIERRQDAIEEAQSELEYEQGKLEDESKKTHYVTHYDNAGFATGQSHVDGGGNATHYDLYGRKTGSSHER